jgi:hypothetical protein
MHDLIEDMGKEIVRQESVREPGKRSRLWFHEDIFQVIEENSVRQYTYFFSKLVLLMIMLEIFFPFMA